MSLHGIIQVNGTTIGSWSAQRIVTRPDGVHTYRWTATERERKWAGDLQHDYADGAVAQDLWEPEARQVLAHPCPKHTHTEEDQ